MNEETRNMLDSQDWDDLLTKLLAYSICLCAGNGAGSVDPEDMLMDSIEKVYDGSRHWDRDKDPDLFRFLKSVIKSHLSNTMSKDRHSRTHVKISAETGPGFVPDDNLYFEQIDRSMIKALNGEADVCLTYKALKDGLRPAEISEEYGMDITVIRNAMKRLRRFMVNIIPSLKNKKY